MRLTKARVCNYRSILDTETFQVEGDKTILVGANEAGKTAILQALQHLSRPDDVPALNPLKDFPRSQYHLIRTGEVKPANTIVVEGWFELDGDDVAELPEGFEKATYYTNRYLDDHESHRIDGGPDRATKNKISKDIARLVAHLKRPGQDESTASLSSAAADNINNLVSPWKDHYYLSKEQAQKLHEELEAAYPYIEEGASAEDERYDKLIEACERSRRYDLALATLSKRLPKFVLFNNYYRVRPRIQLDHLAARVEQNLLDDSSYDYGNLCLLKLLGFTPRELSDLAAAQPPPAGDQKALEKYQAKRDERQYQLNAASLRLTAEIREIWAPNESRGEAAKVRIVPDGQYLKLVVEDSVGVEVELDQRSEGFQWLVSFFVVFFAESGEKHRNAVLLLDEPGVSLHGLKQREFRQTLSKLAKRNQTIYSTHSPFLVGPEELDLVRVVEMNDRASGTKVSAGVAATDSPALLPLQEALGYDMAQSLFSQQKNLVLEGLTDFWYVEAINRLFMDANEKALDKVALIPAGSASKVVYFATILHAHKLKVAALLDSDAAGEQAAKQDALVMALGQKAVLRTKDFHSSGGKHFEIEDLLRETLISVAKSDLAWDVEKAAEAGKGQPIASIFSKNISDFSKYRLAKAFLRWTRTNSINELRPEERESFVKLFNQVNKVLK